MSGLLAANRAEGRHPYNSRPRANLGNRPVRPMVRRPNQRLAGGQISSASIPASRNQATGGRLWPKSRTIPSGKRNNATLIGLPPVGVTRQHSIVADVQALASRIHDHLGQRRHVPQPQVEALAGNRVQGMHGITNQCPYADEWIPWTATAARDRRGADRL